jgi:hypothetical protein
VATVNQADPDFALHPCSFCAGESAAVTVGARETVYCCPSCAESELLRLSARAAMAGAPPGEAGRVMREATSRVNDAFGMKCLRALQGAGRAEG